MLAQIFQDADFCLDCWQEPRIPSSIN